MKKWPDTLTQGVCPDLRTVINTGVRERREVSIIVVTCGACGLKVESIHGRELANDPAYLSDAIDRLQHHWAHEHGFEDHLE